MPLTKRPLHPLPKKYNPYVAGTPIDNPKLFFGRQKLITNILQGVFNNHIAIQGPRRSGKSSLLIQIAQQLNGLDDAEFYFAPVMFDCHETTEASFFHDLWTPYWPPWTSSTSPTLGRP